MIGIHPVHRRLAELHLIAQQRKWTYEEVLELHHCISVNANLVQKLDELKQLAYVAQLSGDMEWVQKTLGDQLICLVRSTWTNG